MNKPSKKIFKSPNILEENNRDNDYLDFSQEINRLKQKLNRIKRNSFIALTSPHGSGKTTILYQLWAELEDPEHLWIQFDAWKYPNRDSLWENFVLEFFKNFEEALFKSALYKLDSQKKESALATGISMIPTEINVGKIFNIIDTLSKETPIKRTFQVQELFLELLNSSTLKSAKTITVILEDIDRSGDKGTFFLETLNYFFKKLSLEKDLPIFKFIVPMEENFLTGDNSKKEKFKEVYNSYLKVFDQIWKLDLSKVNYRPFIEELFTKEIIEQISIEKFSEFFQKLQIATPRELQIHLRHVIDLYDHYIDFDDALNWDPRIIMFIELNKSSDHSIISNFNQGLISQRSLGFTALGSCVIDDRITKGLRTNYYFVEDNQNEYNIPKYRKPFIEGIGEKAGFLISNKYLILI